jgi:hypothetical protein
MKGVRRVLYRLPEVLKAIELGQTIFIAEGEKAVDALVKLGLNATCSPMGAGKWCEEYLQHLAGADVIVLPDNDEPGEKHCKVVAKSLMRLAARVRTLRLPGLPLKGDAFDWVEAGGTAEELWQLVETSSVDASTSQSRLQPLCIHQLFKIEIAEREMILSPIIPEKGLAMLYAPRGVGKTHVACGISYAVATGTKFLQWEAPKPRRVLHCDGEMAAVELRHRFAQFARGKAVEPGPKMLNILSADLTDLGIGNLATPDVQAELDLWLDGVQLLVLDNLSSLTAVIRDNDAESWSPIQEWLLRLRRRGISVLIVHHAGKGGGQRGTSRREDVLDTSISLGRPNDYEAPQGARFEVHLEKARGIHGDEARPFEAALNVIDGIAHWKISGIKDADLQLVRSLLEEGLSIPQIIERANFSRSKIYRLKKQIDTEEQGPLDEAA